MAHAWVLYFGGGVAAMLAMFGLTYSASVAGFMGARFALGLGEAGNFPGAIKTVAEWFPRKERAFATGIFNAGTNIGALLTPLIVPVITIACGWEWAFIATGALGFLWLALWWVSYRSPEEHPRVSQAELAYIRSDPPEPTTKMSWANDPSASPGVDLRRREVHDRSGLVAVSLLDSRLPLPQPRPEPDDDGTADRGDLSDWRRRQRRRRMAVVDADQARLDGERRAQDGDARLRAGGDADRVCRERRRICGSRSG